MEQQEAWEEMRSFFTRNTVVKVVFTKKDGTERTMFCTRISAVIPEESRPKGDKEQKVNHEVMPVFDLEAKAWRSFRLDSVIRHTPVFDEEIINRLM